MISKKKLLTTEDVIDVQREVEILHAVEGHPHIVPIIVCYEDRESVCLVQVCLALQRTNSATLPSLAAHSPSRAVPVCAADAWVCASTVACVAVALRGSSFATGVWMFSFLAFRQELCEGGELFEQITKKGTYTEAIAAGYLRTMLEVVVHVHSMGVVHRDLKPENFLFASRAPNSPLKLIDFGLSAFCKPGEQLTDPVGTPFYTAPEVGEYPSNTLSSVAKSAPVCCVACLDPPQCAASDALRRTTHAVDPCTRGACACRAKHAVHANLCAVRCKAATVNRNGSPLIGGSAFGLGVPCQVLVPGGHVEPRDYCVRDVVGQCTVLGKLAEVDSEEDPCGRL